MSMARQQLTKKEELQQPNTTTPAVAMTTSTTTSAAAAPTTTRIPKKKGPYTNWLDPDNAKHLLCAAQLVINDKLKACEVVAKYQTDSRLPSINCRALC